MDRLLVVVAMALAVGCATGPSSDDKSVGGKGTDGSADSDAGLGGTSQGPGGADGADTAGADTDATGTGTPYDACEELYSGQDACTVEGAECADADDCGGATYRCQDGGWVQIDASGCWADPIACADDPLPGDSCDFEIEVICDPNGDCLDVLECQGYVWQAFDVCTDVACEEAAPQHGASCDLGEGRVCPTSHECGFKMFTCHDGYWVFNGSAICTDPVACEDGPVPNEACATEGEVCTYPNPNEAPVTCTDGIWDT